MMSERTCPMKCAYYSMRICGPLVIFLCTLGISGLIWLEFLFPLISNNVWLQYLLPIGTLFPIAMMVYSALYTILVDNGTTKSVLQSREFASLLTSEFVDGFPPCSKCGLPKPPRAHHCSTCGRCHLRMDHHCPAVGRCIALGNHQSFIVMLNWGTVCCLLYGIIAVYCAKYTKITPFRSILWLLAGVLALLFAMLAGFSAQQIYRARKNITTIELLSYDSSPEKLKKYDLGVEHNLAQLFGTSWYRMWWPMKPRLSGFEWGLQEYMGYLDPITMNG